MTAFIAKEFKLDSENLSYHGEVVSRFKHGRQNVPGFKKFLVQNFTVEEYFKMYDIDKMSPVAILESKGYVETHILKILKEKGLPENQEGFKLLVEMQKK